MLVLDNLSVFYSSICKPEVNTSETIMLRSVEYSPADPLKTEALLKPAERV